MNKSCKKYHLSIYFDKFATSGFSTVIGNYKNVQNDLFFDNYYNATNEKVNYNKILNYINKFHHDKVYVLGYYSISNNNSDIINYANYKLSNLVKKYNYIYIDLSKILDNNPTYISQINNNYLPNIKGYQKISQIIVENLKNN